MCLQPWGPRKADGANGSTSSLLYFQSPLRSPLPVSPGSGAAQGAWGWASLGCTPLGSSSLSPTHVPLVSCADSCSFALHARGREVTRFTTPGFPDSPYPARARCQWTLRGDADLVLSLTFRSFDVAPCDEQGSDLVTVYNSLSPVEPHAVVR